MRNGTDGVDMHQNLPTRISRSTCRLVAASLMIASALGASLMLEPSRLTASAPPSPTAGKLLLHLHGADYLVDVVSAERGVRYDLLDVNGQLMGRFDSMESLTQSTGRSPQQLLAEYTPEEPIN